MDYPTVILSADDIVEVSHGRRVTQIEPRSDELAFAYSENHEFIAILQSAAWQVVPA